MAKQNITDESTPPKSFKRFRIKIDTYSNYVDVYFTDSIYYVVNRLCPGVLDSDEADSYAAGFFTRDHPKKKGVTQYFIVLDINDMTANSIAHEAMHFTSALLTYHDISHDVSNNEPFCYLIGYVVGKIHEKAHKFGILIKPK